MLREKKLTHLCSPLNVRFEERWVSFFSLNMIQIPSSWVSFKKKLIKKLMLSEFKKKLTHQSLCWGNKKFTHFEARYGLQSMPMLLPVKNWTIWAFFPVWKAYRFRVPQDEVKSLRMRQKSLTLRGEHRWVSFFSLIMIQNSLNHEWVFFNSLNSFYTW